MKVTIEQMPEPDFPLTDLNIGQAGILTMTPRTAASGIGDPVICCSHGLDGLCVFPRQGTNGRKNSLDGYRFRRPRPGEKIVFEF